VRAAAVANKVYSLVNRAAATLRRAANAIFERDFHHGEERGVGHREA
jgi:hypothetical protein